MPCRRFERTLRALLQAALCGLPWAACQAGALQYCDHPAPLNAAQKDQLFRFGAIIKTELDNSGAPLALVARSGLDLSRFGLRYSHAGVSLKASPNTRWSVRQLYYACDERRPRIFDQGLSGFLLGTDNPAIGYVSVVFMPATAADELERAALDNSRALQLLNATYSANAYAWGLQYQNCNQWVIELLASAWDDGADTGGDVDARERAQRWLWRERYAPTVFEVSAHPMLWIANVIPWLNNDDHPAAELAANRYDVSMPLSIETFVHRTVPEAARIELCRVGRHVVVHEGWDPIPDGCVARPGDRELDLERG
jgi:hypothetical protein